MATKKKAVSVTTEKLVVSWPSRAVPSQFSAEAEALEIRIKAVCVELAKAEPDKKAAALQVEKVITGSRALYAALRA